MTGVVGKEKEKKMRMKTKKDARKEKLLHLDIKAFSTGR